MNLIYYILNITNKFSHHCARCSSDIVSSTSVARKQLNIVTYYIFIINYNILIYFLRTYKCVTGIPSQLSGLCSLCRTVVVVVSMHIERHLPIIYIIPSCVVLLTTSMCTYPYCRVNNDHLLSSDVISSPLVTCVLHIMHNVII